MVLLGQNVNGYHDASNETAELFPENNQYNATPGFENIFQGRQKSKPGARFADLLEQVADINPEMRVRFTSPHPKDFPTEVLDIIAARTNICPSLHMPAQVSDFPPI